MALATRISNVAAKAACDAITALVNTGKLRIYSGTQPADADTALSGNTLLAEMNLSATAFAAATDSNPGGRASANGLPLTDTSADAAGTATFFRVVNSGGTAVWDGSVGTSSADMILNSTSISLGANVQVTAWFFTVPET